MASRKHYASEASYQRSQEASRQAKLRRRGTCVDCGAVTHYNGTTVNGSSLRCPACANARRGVQLRGRGEVVAQIIDVLGDGPMRYTEIAEAIGKSPNYMGQAFSRLLRHGLIVRPSRGVYALPENQPR